MGLEGSAGRHVAGPVRRDQKAALHSVRGHRHARRFPCRQSLVPPQNGVTGAAAASPTGRQALRAAVVERRRKQVTIAQKERRVAHQSATCDWGGPLRGATSVKHGATAQGSGFSCGPLSDLATANGRKHAQWKQNPPPPGE